MICHGFVLLNSRYTAKLSVMCSEQLPKEFEKTTEVLPFTRYGVSTVEEFKNAEKEVRRLEFLKMAGLTSEEIVLYDENESGRVNERSKIEHSVLKSKLSTIYDKIKKYNSAAGSSSTSSQLHNEPSTSKNAPENLIEQIHRKPIKFYPEGHPMNELKEIDESLFGHLKNDNIIPITKRIKILRRFERKKQRLLSQQKQLQIGTVNNVTVNRPGSLWDMKEMPIKMKLRAAEAPSKCVIGPKRQTMYTIKDNKIVRLEPVPREDNVMGEEYHAVDIVVPVNAAEEQLLEGTKMSVDDIRKIDRFKDYEPGVPSKILYLKNIAPSVSQEQLSLLFNQFVLDNGGPIEVRLLAGRMRGQAFVTFQTEELAIRALDEVCGTVLGGRPVVAQFGRRNDGHDNR